MRLITAIVGGSVGSDPYGAGTWSGAAPRLFRAMEAGGLLERAIGVDLPGPVRAALLLKNFRRDRGLWRKQFFLDPAYRSALTRAVRKLPVSTLWVMQIGAMFSVPEAPGRRFVSYHDGNLAESVRSGFGLKGVSATRIDHGLRAEERIANEMTAVFTFSEYLRQSFIRDYHVPEQRVFNVGGAMNLSTIPLWDAEKDFRTPRIVFIGKDFDRKGGPMLLRAFERVRQSLPDAELHVMGPARIGSAPDGVTVHGFVDRSTAEGERRFEAVMRRGTLFVLPSLYEPYGIAPIEAMLYGMPAVVTGAWALAETVRPGENGAHVARGDEDALAETLIRLSRDPVELARMGARGRSLALQDYTWESVVTRMTKAFSVLQGS